MVIDAPGGLMFELVELLVQTSECFRECSGGDGFRVRRGLRRRGSSAR
jgi:hypothetical protein